MFVKAKVDIIEPANEDHPVLLLASKGDILEITDSSALYEIPVINRKYKRN